MVGEDTQKFSGANGPQFTNFKDLFLLLNPSCQGLALLFLFDSLHPSPLPCFLSSPNKGLPSWKTPLEKQLMIDSDLGRKRSYNPYWQEAT